MTILDMETAIRATLDRMDRTQFAYSTNDCDTVIADYVVMRTGRDPMAKWRGAYADNIGALELIYAAGGNATLVAEGMASIGIAEKAISDLTRGDICMIEIGHHQITGIFLEPFSAFKGISGRVMTKRIPIKAWPCA